ncbi:MAG: hypothetical protein LBP75_08310 [Planctomycetota bacterium]|jgi:L-alanine-DL-glutamate epimerase-like enolase superfamily enzyme|nr:hypothetical protein [Planctomycetota bacterium]
MRFTSATIYQVRIPFRFAFKHALAERRCADSVLFSATLADGATGWGEAAPRAYLTGETVETVSADLRVWANELRAVDFSGGQNPLPLLRPFYVSADAQRKNAAYAALELAVIDALTKSAGQSAAAGLGLPVTAPRLALTAPLGSASGKKLRGLTHLCRWLGYRDFKLKVGVDGADTSGADTADADIERIKTVKEIIGADRDLRLDANAAWDAATAIRIIDAVRPLISSVEQPAATMAELATIRRATGCPVMADESLCARADAAALLATGAADIWNLRLGKIGGFNGLFALRDLARQNNIKLHLGALVGETALLTNAGRVAALAANFAHCEYGYPRILLRGDPFRGGVAGYRGWGKPLRADARGFGTRVLPELLMRVKSLELKV